MCCEERFVIYENTKIKYTLTRKKVKNINLRIYPDGQVHVSARNNVKISLIENFILSNGAKIINKKQSPAISKDEYISNTHVYIFGEKININITMSTNKKNSAFISCNNVEISNNILLDFWRNKKNFSDVSLYLSVSDILDNIIIQKTINNWLSSLITFAFNQVCREIYPLFYNIDFPIIKSRRMKSRWGSCSPYKNIVTLNTSLIHKPLVCLEYVALHEFCHFVHPNHSKEFYSFVNSLMSDWKDRRSLLNSN